MPEDQTRTWRIVGIDGRATPDPNYWFARWGIYESESDREAIGQWFHEFQGWARAEERPYVKVHATLTAWVDVHDWIDEHMKRGVPA
jgi:hypothetical protein